MQIKRGSDLHPIPDSVAEANTDGAVTEHRCFKTCAGDTPYHTEANFLRTICVQGYSPYSVNDYHTITNEDLPQDAACVVVKMMAVCMPSYSIDFGRRCQANKDVIRRYKRWYNDNLAACALDTPCHAARRHAAH